MTTDNNDLFNPASLDDPREFDIDPTKDYLTEFTSEGGKFYDPNKDVALQKLARAKAESDAHIARLEKEAKNRNEDLQAIQDELRTRTRLEEIMDKITKGQNSNTPSPTPQERNNEGTNASGMSEDQIKALVASMNAQAEEARKRKENSAIIQSKLVEKYGKNYTVVLNEKSQALGLSKEDTKRLAETAPYALIEMLGIDKAPVRETNIPRPAVNSSAFNNKGEVKKTYSYYENIKKTDKALYDSPRIQKERWEMANKLGDEFFDVD